MKTKLKTLIIDDSPEILTILTCMLQYKGHETACASNGADGLALLENSTPPFDLVLVDSRMPGISGAEVCHQIKHHKTLAITPRIILCSGDAHVAGDVPNPEIDGYLAKPFTRTDLETLLATVVGTCTPETPSAPLTDLPPIEGLDIAAGLSYSANNMVLYKKLLSGFPESYGRVTESIRASLSADDLKTATREAHSLKGIAGTLGAYALQKAAGELEAALLNNERSSAPQSLDKIQALLQPLVKQIRSAIPSGAPLDAPAPYAPEKIRDILPRLFSQLALGESGAATSLEELKKAGVLPSIYPEMRQVEALIKRYEFHDALLLLQQLTHRLD